MKLTLKYGAYAPEIEFYMWENLKLNTKWDSTVTCVSDKVFLCTYEIN
jgi:hypothetical protein